ncbi:PIG-L deacetylase family protein [Nostocoides sp. HKS02]|uniref:PIG-L deacetylase family protein n=1 Tax=Nostocoides sp. HKS02 TaxID=1813880 RepID=UPI0012B4F496|nr:PIG-L family deacetylase [Tetrasphaera sp. HKS02]QGN58676.1 GlcNAc-PI de-N-acetylase [Tetrasphaera sp. HKS02]
MSTIVFLHAHPDDEASQTAGSMARAVAEGHRVVTVFATNGDHGELPAAGLPEGETLVDWRRREAEASAAVLGVQRIAWLGYRDSGMTGWAQNSEDGAFHSADVDEAATRLARILDEEDADVLVGYDWHGGYGHPDHVKVHAVVHRAAELAARRPRLLESTMNRDLIRGFYEAAVASGNADRAFDPDSPMDDGNPLGSPESEITWQVDVSDYLPQRRAALEAHRSQATDIEGMLSMPEEFFGLFFGREHYIEPIGSGGSSGSGASGAAVEPRAPMQLGWPFGD